jgi:hypothetical protein
MAQPASQPRLTRVPTPEEIRRVHEHDCSTQGHVFDQLVPYGSRDPLGLVCLRCDRQWPVGEGSGGAE